MLDSPNNVDSTQSDSTWCTCSETATSHWHKKSKSSCSRIWRSFIGIACMRHSSGNSLTGIGTSMSSWISSLRSKISIGRRWGIGNSFLCTWCSTKDFVSFNKKCLGGIRQCTRCHKRYQPDMKGTCRSQCSFHMGACICGRLHRNCTIQMSIRWRIDCSM